MLRLETPRLILRALVKEDALALVAVLGDPEVMRYSVSGVKTLSQIHEFIERCQESYRNEGFGHWAVVLKDTGQCIGFCGISRQPVADIKEYEIGYRLAQIYWGQGFATEAALACRDFGLNQLHLKRLVAIIEADNHASIRVAEKLGMRDEKASVFHGIPVRIYALDRP